MDLLEITCLTTDNSRVLPGHEKRGDEVEYRLLFFPVFKDRGQQIDYTVECGSTVPEVLD